MINKKSLQKCKEDLKTSAKKSEKGGFHSDSADAMFRVFVLDYLEVIAKKANLEYETTIEDIKKELLEELQLISKDKYIDDWIEEKLNQ